MRDQILEHLRQEGPRSKKEVVEALKLQAELVEQILDELKRDGQAVQLHSGRWEATMSMPNIPYDNRGQSGRRRRLERR